MREIKFRGKKLYGKGWVYGDLLQDPFHTFICNKYTVLGDFVQAHAIEVDKETVGQYTGLKDKNGKEVYEGDIVKARNRYYSIVTYGEYMPEVLEEWAKYEFVVFKPKILGFYFIGVSKENKNHIAFIPTEKQAFEVIGNIYENPELLKEGE